MISFCSARVRAWKARHKVIFDKISRYFDILEELAEEIGLNVGACGNRTVADFQMMNSSEMCLMNSLKVLGKN